MKKTKNYKKSLKSLDKLIEVKEIYNNGIQLKNGTFVTGIKVEPFDLWTSSDVKARSILINLMNVYKAVNFPIYQNLVYTPSSFETLENSLLKELEVAEKHQSEIIVSDLEKISEFSKNNKKVEFFIFIKHKNLKTLAQRLEILKSEFERVFITNELYYLDYVNYVNWLFDIEDSLISKAYYKGNDLEISNTEPVEVISKYDDLEEKDIKENHVSYNLYEFHEYENHFVMNGINYSLILIKGLPNPFEVGLFNYVGRNQNIKMMFKSENSECDLITHIKKNLKNLEEIAKKAEVQRNEFHYNEIINEINALKTFSAEMAMNGDKTLDVSLAFIVSHHDLKELNYIKKNFIQELRHTGFKLFSPKMLQVALFKFFTPIFDNKDITLSDIHRFNIGFPLSSQSLALTYPYHFSTLEDSNGFLYGYEKNMYGRIVFNPYLYKDNAQQGVKENRLSGNIILIGETGSGKSTDMFLYVRYLQRRKAFQMWIDPENKNKKYTIKNGGIYLEFGSDKFMFNLWQLTRVASDEEDNNEVHYNEMWNTEMAIINAIDMFKKVLVLYCKEIKDNTLNVVGMIAKKMYENKNITPQITPLFDTLKNTDFPIMTDFAMALAQIRQEALKNNNVLYVNACEDLLMKITPMLEEHRFLFNGHTTHDIKVQAGTIVGIGTKQLYLKDRNVQNALYYIIYSQAFNYCLDDKVDSAFIYDEAHTTMKNEQTNELLDQLTRRSRKYNNLTILGTQEPLDFDNPSMEGIINNTTYIVVKMLTKNNALQTLQRMIGLEDVDLEKIKLFDQGDSYFKCGGKAYYMHTILSDKENQDKGNNYS